MYLPTTACLALTTLLSNNVLAAPIARSATLTDATGHYSKLYSRDVTADAAARAASSLGPKSVWPEESKSPLIDLRARQSASYDDEGYMSGDEQRYSKPQAAGTSASQPKNVHFYDEGYESGYGGSSKSSPYIPQANTATSGTTAPYPPKLSTPFVDEGYESGYGGSSKSSPYIPQANTATSGTTAPYSPKLSTPFVDEGYESGYEGSTKPTPYIPQANTATFQNSGVNHQRFPNTLDPSLNAAIASESTSNFNTANQMDPKLTTPPVLDASGNVPAGSMVPGTTQQYSSNPDIMQNPQVANYPPGEYQEMTNGKISNPFNPGYAGTPATQGPAVNNQPYPQYPPGTVAPTDLANPDQSPGPAGDVNSTTVTIPELKQPSINNAATIGSIAASTAMVGLLAGSVGAKIYDVKTQKTKDEKADRERIASQELATNRHNDHMAALKAQTEAIQGFNGQTRTNAAAQNQRVAPESYHSSGSTTPGTTPGTSPGGSPKSGSTGHTTPSTPATPGKKGGAVNPGELANKLGSVRAQQIANEALTRNTRLGGKR